MTGRSGFQALLFVVVSGLLLAAAGLVMGGFTFEPRRNFGAVFANSNGLKHGDVVRAAGVDVGTVSSIVVRADSTVLVRFSLSTAVPLTSAARAAIRFKSLTGVKYLELSQPGADGPALRPGSSIPLARTDPGLDIDAVFGSFRPLIQGLSPDQVNRLTASVIEVFQGQAASVQGLLSDLGSLTSSLADRDQVIGDLITNLNGALGSLDSRRSEIGDLVGNLRSLVTSLAQQRDLLASATVSVSDLARDGSASLARVRPGVKSTVDATRRALDALNTDLPLVQHYIRGMPKAVELTGRLGAYGSFYSLYVCGLTVRLSVPGGGYIDTPTLEDKAPRCQLDGAGAK